MSQQSLQVSDHDEEAKLNAAKPTCGIVMPISAMNEYSVNHWEDVLLIIKEVIEEAGFTGDLVSKADEINVIQKTIVQNIYSNDVVICDVSGKNSNVMFELGMRLAFDKPTIIIKDDITDYSFDTSPIEHLPYRRDLRFPDTRKFKLLLKVKLESTHQRKQKDPAYSPFLKNFGEFVVAKLEEKEVPQFEFIMRRLTSIENKVSSSPLQTVNQLSRPVEMSDAQRLLTILAKHFPPATEFLRTLIQYMETFQFPNLTSAEVEHLIETFKLNYPEIAVPGAMREIIKKLGQAEPSLETVRGVLTVLEQKQTQSFK